jgi:hypothetical protein
MEYVDRITAYREENTVDRQSLAVEQVPDFTYEVLVVLRSEWPTLWEAGQGADRPVEAAMPSSRRSWRPLSDPADDLVDLGVCLWVDDNLESHSS